MDFDGLRTSIIEMLSGSSVEVNVNEFQNDMVSFADKDDVLTLLIHLGYLTYDQRNQRAYSVTVPSIVIMVPGLYLYRGFYLLDAQKM